MADWTKSMKQTFEYYIVDPGTWKDIKRLTQVKSSTLTRESGSETLGSASFSITELVGECYIRVYLIVIQDNIKEKIPLGTYLVQTPTSEFNGRIHNFDLEAYTPLLELKEKQPALGYTISKKGNSNIMNNAYMLTRENVRAPVIETESSEKLENDFVSNTDDTWLSFISDLIDNAKYEFYLDELGQITFAPIQEVDKMSPIWTFDDDNSSILLPEISMDNDIYGIPNVVEVNYTNGLIHYYERVVNNDENSPVSTISRGREIVHRVTEPNLAGIPTKIQIKEYAETLLKRLSSIQYTITYEHGYCPVRVGDCVRLNYKKAGISDVKAKVISQTISCKSGCTVKEKAVFTGKLWR